MASPGLAKSPLLSPPNLSDELTHCLHDFSISFGHFQQYARGGSQRPARGVKPGFAKGLGEVGLPSGATGAVPPASC